jgi:hypothetical protein
MQMESTDDKYVYFRPDQILYLLWHNDDQLLSGQVNREQGQSRPNNEAMNVPDGNQPIDTPSDDEAKTAYSKTEVNEAEAKMMRGEKRIEGDQNETAFDNTVNKLIEWSNQEADKLNIEHKLKSKITISRLKERELHFPGTGQLFDVFKQDIKLPADVKYKSPEIKPRGAFSLIPAELKIPVMDRDANNPEGFVEPSELAELIRNLDNARVAVNQNLTQEGITLEVVSPNWLSSPCSEWGGGGGPGSRPVAYEGRADSAPYKFRFFTNKNIEKVLPEEMERGKGVKVAILDTAPCLHDLAEAYELYYKVDPEKQQKQKQEVGGHPLIETLLRPNGPLHVHPASLEDLLRMRHIHLRDHNYKMTDHGLFVAGIINSIAPAAEIHLYEVLNPEGVGDLESIAKALLEIAMEQYHILTKTGKMQRLVVNCSLMLNIPLQGDPNSPTLAPLISSDPSRPIVGHRLTDLDEAFLQKLSGKDWADRAGFIIMWICDLLFLLGSRVIAAAGNDWDPTDPGRPLARYLAAFPSVQGVGALPKEQDPQAFQQTRQYAAASYSNLSDQPGKVGVATLGGEPGEGKGVLGIYLGEFPSGDLPIIQRFLAWLAGLFGGKLTYPKNKSHWAWWAGTSFATPILTAVIAAVLSSPNPPSTTEGAILKLYYDQAIEESKTNYQEDLLNVRQG